MQYAGVVKHIDPIDTLGQKILGGSSLTFYGLIEGFRDAVVMGRCIGGNSCLNGRIKKDVSAAAKRQPGFGLQVIIIKTIAHYEDIHIFVFDPVFYIHPGKYMPILSWRCELSSWERNSDYQLNRFASFAADGGKSVSYFLNEVCKYISF